MSALDWLYNSSRDYSYRSIFAIPVKVGFACPMRNPRSGYSDRREDHAEQALRQDFQPTCQCYL